MNLKNALTGNRVATHFGLSDGEKLSASGVLSFLYQSIAIVLCASVVLFTGTNAISASGIPVLALLAVTSVLGFTLGAKALIGLGNAATNRIAGAFPNRALRFAVSLVLMLAFLAVVMAWPAAFLFGLAKVLPSVVTFTGWSNAFTAGFGVLCADTILGGLTGVSLLAGKREKIIK
jgi:hypothetical protein